MVSGLLVRRLLRVLWWILAIAWLSALPWVVWEFHTHNTSTWYMARVIAGVLCFWLCLSAFMKSLCNWNTCPGQSFKYE
eukprot:jgi/Botrbrau1/18427/Bobra.0072s0019.1